MEGPSLGVNGHSFFLDSTVTSSPDLELYTDDAMSVIKLSQCFNQVVTGLPCGKDEPSRRHIVIG